MRLHQATLIIALKVFHTQAQYPMPFPQPMSMAAGMPSMQMGMPSMPMQMPIIGPPQLPTVVMPYHSRTADKLREKPKKPKKERKEKKRRNRQYESESDSDSDSESYSESSSSSGEQIFRARAHGHKRRRQVLTPVVSYVTKDGYVVYQKKIKKDRAKDWLELGKNSGPNALERKDSQSDELEMGKENRKKHRSKSNRVRHRD